MSIRSWNSDELEEYYVEEPCRHLVVDTAMRYIPYEERRGNVYEDWGEQTYFDDVLTEETTLADIRVLLCDPLFDDAGVLPLVEGHFLA